MKGRDSMGNENRHRGGKGLRTAFCYRESFFPPVFYRPAKLMLVQPGKTGPKLETPLVLIVGAACATNCTTEGRSACLARGEKKASRSISTWRVPECGADDCLASATHRRAKSRRKILSLRAPKLLPAMLDAEEKKSKKQMHPIPSVSAKEEAREFVSIWDA